jgi:(R)-2-hydroxyacyl-CoA dehydratese activating ATPase
MKTLFSGIDAGARATKTVIIDGGGNVVAQALRKSGPDPEANSEAVFAEALSAGGIRRADVAQVVATGYGRGSIKFAGRVVTEITCHARGVRHLLPQARTIVDIGGQDSKIIFLDADGSVRDFAMNERCAAGTGRFLEVLSDIVHVPLDKMAAVAAGSASPCVITSTCAVFAESEVVGLLSQGRSAADVIAGVHEALAKRVVSLCRGIRAVPPVAFTGGVALNAGMVAALARALGEEIVVPEHPQLTGALGAALIARAK